MSSWGVFTAKGHHSLSVGHSFIYLSTHSTNYYSKKPEQQPPFIDYNTSGALHTSSVIVTKPREEGIFYAHFTVVKIAPE